ncbi:hypothetical protein Tco_1203810 [Tanacetum coccineum]
MCQSCLLGVAHKSLACIRLCPQGQSFLHTPSTGRGTSCFLPPEETSYSLPLEETSYSLLSEETDYSLPPEGTSYSLPPEGTIYSLPLEEILLFSYCL